MAEKQQPVRWLPLLLAWFRSHRRDLPWRCETPRDPYKVWVSEIMLQQTKVETVKPYYEHWLERFPTTAALAAAAPDEVLKEWQGLGYYSRARNLHEAVREVQRVYGGSVPDTKEELLRLKGVGEYTAGAILSLAYGRDEVAVDGNVLRIFARMYNITENVLAMSVRKKVTALAAAQLEPRQGAVMCEALMDFGAAVCIPKNPRCHVCPLTKHCLAYQNGTAGELPVRTVKKNVPTEYLAVVVIRRQGRWILHRRPEKGLLASMWEFPVGYGRGKKGREDALRTLRAAGLEVLLKEKAEMKLKHVFSHKIWQMTVYAGTIQSGLLTEKEDWQELPCDAYADVPWAGPHGKIAAMM